MFERFEIYYNRRACTLGSVCAARSIEARQTVWDAQSIEYFVIERKVRKNDMCGIADTLLTNASKINPDQALIVSRMVGAIRHRGADDLGVLTESGVALSRILALGIAYKKTSTTCANLPLSY